MIKSGTVIFETFWDYRAMGIVSDYIDGHLDKNDEPVKYNLFVVWKAKVLQNWKFLISSTLQDGMYYEVTYNGDKKEWYLDAYIKFENKSIPDIELSLY